MLRQGAEMPLFIAEVSSNHARDLDRCLKFIEVAASAGCQAVKFQLFKIEELFAPEILKKSQEHRRRKEWELPKEFLPELQSACQLRNMQFSCTPFYLDAVEELLPYVDFYKIASYELLWDDLIKLCAETGKPLVLSTGMATMPEIHHAVSVFKAAGGNALTLLHCVSGYPVRAEDCNLAAIDAIRRETGCKVGWSDHSRDAAVVHRAIDRWGAEVIEFHLDLDEQGAEYSSGHCWLPNEIEDVLAARRRLLNADGTGDKKPTRAEEGDRPWRADPGDGLRPLKDMRASWVKE